MRRAPGRPTSAHGARSVGAYRGWEKRRERDQAVTVNLDIDLQPLWNRVQAAFHGTPEERLRAFEQYVHDHPGEEWGALEDAAEAKLEALLEARARRKAG